EGGGQGEQESRQGLARGARHDEALRLAGQPARAGEQHRAGGRPCVGSSDRSVSPAVPPAGAGSAAGHARGEFPRSEGADDLAVRARRVGPIPDRGTRQHLSRGQESRNYPPKFPPAAPQARDQGVEIPEWEIEVPYETLTTHTVSASEVKGVEAHPLLVHGHVRPLM